MSVYLCEQDLAAEKNFLSESQSIVFKINEYSRIIN